MDLVNALVDLVKYAETRDLVRVTVTVPGTEVEGPLCNGEPMTPSEAAVRIARINETLSNVAMTPRFFFNV